MNNVLYMMNADKRCLIFFCGKLDNEKMIITFISRTETMN